jgi:hypothetical protein
VPSGCAQDCEARLSAVQRDCVAAASSCSAVDACGNEGGNADAGKPSDGGKPSGDDAGTSNSTTISSPQDLLAKWNDFGVSVVAEAKADNRGLGVWEIDVSVNGKDVFDDTTADYRDSTIAEKINKLTVASTDRISARFSVQAYDDISHQYFTWKTRSFSPAF